MNDPLEWYQIATGFLLLAIVTCTASFQRLTKIVWVDLREMWHEGESGDPLWAKLIQSVAFLGYFVVVAMALYALFQLGTLLYEWWLGTLVSIIGLTLTVLVVLLARKFQKRTDTRK